MDKPGNLKSNQTNLTGKEPGRFRFKAWWLYLVLLVLILFPSLFGSSYAIDEISWQQFEKDIVSRNAVEKIVVINSERAEIYIKTSMSADPQFKEAFKPIIGKGIRPGPHYYFNIGSIESFERRLDELQKGFPASEKISVSYATKTNWFWNIMGWIFPIILLFILWNYILRKSGTLGAGTGSSSIFNFGKSTATLVEKEKSNVTFDDVAGLEEAEMEVREIVDFLKNPESFTRLGAKIPKGVILVGPPGTGKTLLAKAVAGEAQVPFFSISGSEFVEMFVGVGASRVRDLFKQAKEKAPCIIFIDEIDALADREGKELF